MPPYTPSTLNIIHAIQNASQNASQIQMQEEGEMLEQERTIKS